MRELRPRREITPDEAIAEIERRTADGLPVPTLLSHRAGSATDLENRQQARKAAL